MKKIRVISTFALAAALVMAAFPAGSVLADPAGPVTSAVNVSPNPATYGASVTLTATVDSTATSDAVIQSAEYSVNGGAWVLMTASDGSFDTVTENVTVTFTATPVGTYNVCVRGTDVTPTIGDPVCTSLTVQSSYAFTGFNSPIKMGKVNKANAPQTIPVKWKLALASDGSIVNDPSSFVALKSYAVDCTLLTGDITTAVAEKGPGKTGLTYLGSGKWQFNWKTPKAYRHTCRSMFVLFSDTSMSQQVLFSFK